MTTADRRLLLLAGSTLPLLASCATPRAEVSIERSRSEVRAAEIAFAATMAARDLAAFGGFIAPDAVFLNGGAPLRGKPAILAFWARYFRQPEAPFSWSPEVVEVASGGWLGYTEGDVLIGRRPTLRFYTTWQRQADGSWLVAFDNGYELRRGQP